METASASLRKYCLDKMTTGERGAEAEYADAFQNLRLVNNSIPGMPKIMDHRKGRPR